VSAVTVERRWVIRGIWLGLVLTVAGFYLIRIPFMLPNAPMLRHAQLTLAVFLAFPTATLLLAAAVAAVRRQSPTRWLNMALGAAVADIALVLFVIVVISAMAAMAMLFLR
jgi:hypothetical protein